MRTVLALAAAVLATTAVAQAPAAGPAAEVMTRYNSIKDNVMKAADKMPAEFYSFRPHSEQRTFARVVNHITESQFGACGSVLKMAPADRPKMPAETADKAMVIEALKASFAACDKAYATITAANMTDAVAGPRGGSRALITVLWGNIAHDMEQYAILSDYLRDKNIAPPTSEK